MRAFDRSDSDSTLTGVVDVVRWEQYGLGDVLPFHAMWYVVPPSASAPRDQHPENELSIVITGDASVETGGRVTEVAHGGAFLIDSGEAHVVHNHSAATPLLVFSAYWLPESADRAAAGAGKGGR